MTTSSSEPVRLNKHLALALGFSRRQADELISQGDVTIDGEQATLGARFNPSTQTILVKGKPVATDTTLRYMAFNKPVGYVCSRRAQGDAPTIYDLLPPDFRALKPVGRLDKDSSGIILLTNDGDFAHTMTHPSFHKTKQYLVTLDQPLQPLHRQMISDFGVMLEDGPSKLQLERVEMAEGRWQIEDGEAVIVKDQVDRPTGSAPHNGSNPDTNWKISMHEGRNRQIRRTFAALGYEVVHLHRTQFGAYQLDTLASGEWQEITQK